MSDSGMVEKSSLPSVAELAANACAMPWEDKAPFSVRYEFKEAITPELVTELLEALKEADWYIGQLEMLVYSDDDTGTHESRAKVQAAIRKATQGA